MPHRFKVHQFKERLFNQGGLEMAQIELTIEEVIYLEETLRRIQGTGGPTGFKEEQDLAQQILDKLEEVG